jgi:hypothetical protein
MMAEYTIKKSQSIYLYYDDIERMRQLAERYKIGQADLIRAALDAYERERGESDEA